MGVRTACQGLVWFTVSVLCLTSGCAWRSSPKSAMPGDAAPMSLPTAATDVTTAPAIDQWPSVAGTEPEGGFTSTVTGAVTSFVQRLKPEPKVVPAPDPVSLNTEPEEIGSDLHYHAARVFEAQGNLEAALHHYDKALEIDPNDYRVLVSCGRLFDRQDQMADAEDYYRRAIEAQPSNPTAYNDLGMCYARHGLPDQALRALEQAVGLRPDSALYRNNLAAVLVDLNQFDQALACLAAVHGEAGARYNLAFLLAQRRRPDLARQWARAALQLAPQMQAASDLLEQLDESGARPVAGRLPPPAGTLQTSSLRSPAVSTLHPARLPVPSRGLR